MNKDRLKKMLGFGCGGNEGVYDNEKPGPVLYDGQMYALGNVSKYRLPDMIADQNHPMTLTAWNMHTGRVAFVSTNEIEIIE